MNRTWALVCGMILLCMVVISLHSRNVDLVHEAARANALAKEVEGYNREFAAANDALREQVISLHHNLTEIAFASSQCEGDAEDRDLFARLSPQHRVDLASVDFSDEGVHVALDDIIPGIVAPSRSMAPLLDEGNIVLEVVPERDAEIFPGDIIIYELSGHRIIHRVLRVGQDEEGWFAITKGDNNPVPDDAKVRFSQVRGVVVGIIY